MKSVRKFIKKFAVLRKVEILTAKVTYYITPSTLSLKNLPLTVKEAYNAYMSTPVYACTHCTDDFGSLQFSKLPRQHPQAGKTSGPPAATDIDVICVADAITPGALVEKVTKTLHRQDVVGVVLTLQLIGGVQVPGAGESVCLERYISRGLHKLNDVVTVRHRRFHIFLGLLADGKAVIVSDQPPQTL